MRHAAIASYLLSLSDLSSVRATDNSGNIAITATAYVVHVCVRVCAKIVFATTFIIACRICSSAIIVFAFLCSYCEHTSHTHIYIHKSVDRRHILQNGRWKSLPIEIQNELLQHLRCSHVHTHKTNVHTRTCVCVCVCGSACVWSVWTGICVKSLKVNLH